jgi:hypothetical protein
MYRFCENVIVVFGEYYLREPNMDDTARLLSINESSGFPGMLGSIDCMHWQWKNVTSQDFIKFWREIFVLVIFVLIEISQGFKTFLIYLKVLLENHFKLYLFLEELL